MHLLPAERSGHRVIDGERVCEAIAALGEPGAIEARARQFALLGDPTRLALLTCIKAAGPPDRTTLAPPSPPESRPAAPAPAKFT